MIQSHKVTLLSNKKSEVNLNVLKYNDNQDELLS